MQSCTAHVHLDSLHNKAYGDMNGIAAALPARRCSWCKSFTLCIQPYSKSKWPSLLFDTRQLRSHLGVHDGRRLSHSLLILLLLNLLRILHADHSMQVQPHLRANRSLKHTAMMLCSCASSHARCAMQVQLRLKSQQHRAHTQVAVMPSNSLNGPPLYAIATMAQQTIASAHSKSTVRASP